MPRISRRKWQEAIRCLKDAIKTETKLPWIQKLRAVELLMTIYGLSIPEGGRREKRAVRQMVEERSGERTVNEQIKQAVQERVKEEAEEVEQDRVSKALQDFLRGSNDAKTE
jgi:hypothetical protein